MPRAKWYRMRIETVETDSRHNQRRFKGLIHFGYMKEAS